MRWVMVPSAPFRDVPMPAGADYRQARMWIARPDIAGNPCLWAPPGFARRRAAPRARRSSSSTRPASSNPRAWNAPIDDRGIAGRAPPCSCAARRARSIRSAQVWAPEIPPGDVRRLPDQRGECARARSISPIATSLAAYEEFLREAPADRPIILAAHSQGSAHLMRLLQERIRGAPEARRVVAAYLVGWPVSVTADLPALALPRLRAARPGGLHPLLAELRRARRSEPDHRRL